MPPSTSLLSKKRPVLASEEATLAPEDQGGMTKKDVAPVVLEGGGSEPRNIKHKKVRSLLSHVRQVVKGRLFTTKGPLPEPLDKCLLSKFEFLRLFLLRFGLPRPPHNLNPHDQRSKSKA